MDYQKSKIEYIKNINIFKKVFSNLNKRIFLEISKYNKKIQVKLNLDINDYKEGFLKYSPIEIEIIPIECNYAKFLNIYNKEEESYYHIYFNNSKDEIKRTFCEKKDKVEKIKIKVDYQVKSFHKLFKNCNCIKSIKFKKFNRNTINNMSCMFGFCSSLIEIDLSQFKTDNVKNMSDMFCWCVLLKELNLSNFNTENVNDMAYLFSGCKSLKELNLSNFNTINVNDINGIFNECSSLTKVDVSSFNTENITKMEHMFNGCSSLKELNLSNFNTKNTISMDYMFSGCSSLKELDLSNFHNSNKIQMDCMFYYCSSLKKLNFPNVNANAKDIFYKCPDGIPNKYEKKKSESDIDFNDLNDDDFDFLG